MSANPNITDLRAHLFRQLEALNDSSKPADIARARAVAEVAQVVVETMKVEVEMLAILKGAADVPFIESQTPALPADTPPAAKALTAMERTARVLTSGPSADHRWRRG